MNRLKGLAATSILAILLIGMPTLLVALGIPRLATSANPLDVLLRPDDGTLLLAILWALAWIAWLIIAVTIAAELLAAVGRVPAPHLTGLHLPQAWAHQLVGTAALLFVATSSITPAHATPPTPALTTHQQAQTPAPTPAIPLEQPAESTPGTISYVVQPGDSLWRIAERHLGAGDQYPQIVALNTQRLGGKPDFLQPGWTLQLPTPTTPTLGAQTSPTVVTVQPGDTLTQLAHTHLGDPDRWPEIYQASRHLSQPSGARLEDPDHIEPGWTLHLPISLNPAEAPSADITGPAIQEPVPSEAGSEQSAPHAPELHADVAPDVDALEVPTHSRVGPTPLPGSDPSAEASSPAGDEVASDLDEPPVASWVVAGLAGGGVLCGSLALGLARRRALLARFRRPGRAIPTTPKPLAPLEKTITTRPQVALDVADLDGLLWWTAHEHHTHGLPVPTILALSINPQQVTIHLAIGQELLPPWQTTGDEDTRWSLDRDRLPLFGPDRPGAPAWPQLTSIGVTETGTTWLLNLEAAGILHLAGDPTQTSDFTRHLVAELALNPWARDVRIDCLNICHELVNLDPTKVRHHTHAGTLIDTAQVQAADTASELTQTQGGTLALARASNAGYDLWPSHALIIGIRPDAADLDQLATTVLSHPERPTGTSLVLTTPTSINGAMELRLTSQGRAHLPALDLDLIAVGLTSDEAQGCADLIAAADTLHDTPNPPDEHPPTPVPTDVTGNLTDPRLLDRTQPDDQTVCLLPEPDDTYLAVAATTSDDLATLAPHIPATLAEAIHDADPTLDADLAEWHAGDGPRPRLSVLGPIHARVGHGGNPLAATKRKPFYTELLAYLWTRPHGATTDQVTEALGISEDRARRDLSKLREWLGTNPTTGQPHLPPAMKSKTGQRLGVGVYEVEDLLVDADLFKRLRTRAQARGEDGLADLHAALSLVQGAPFTEVRPQGGAWLVDTATPHHLRAAIVDVAHILHIAALTAGDTEQALWAAHTANQAAPDEITPQLDLTAAAHATGRHLEADRLLTNALLDDQTEAPLDPSPRTHQVLAQRNWTNA